MVVLATRYDGYQVDDDIERLDLPLLTEWLTKQFWSWGTTQEKVTNGIRNSWNFGLYAPRDSKTADRLVGFVRLITDRTGFYYVTDVFIDSDVRRQGLGQFLLSSVLDLPEVQEMKGYLYAMYPRTSQWYEQQFGFHVIAVQRISYKDGSERNRASLEKGPGPLSQKSKKPQNLGPTPGAVPQWITHLAAIGLGALLMRALSNKH
eukprot:gnl/MRDRNA2_/MRDRNA2_67266_c0_seq1.p1 gnl/MRDRNA2_/MRDRNA2_67266_c0~~gnl/MRDRNA2_/MRDRNA2_67266_c0_seq1.p1  ORF type:complete len:205 (-),score=24.43 gnl/MRDRNA2_/MRDRNA2_67266_c0_seq1:226-840(-)